jgi:hypothetical protein
VTAGFRWWGTTAIGLLVATAAVAAAGCGGGSGAGSGNTARAAGTVLDQRTLTIGAEAQMVTLGRGRERIEVEIPPMAAARGTTVVVRLESEIPARRGPAPVGGLALHVATANLTFQQPARMRQPVSEPPPPGRRYVAVQSMSSGDSWDARGMAMEAGESPDGQMWEAEFTGSGLWGIGLVDSGTGAGGIGGGVGGTGGGGGSDGAGGTGGSRADAGMPGDAPDGGGTVMPGQPPQLATLMPLVGPVGMPVELTLTGSNLSDDAVVYFSGQKVTTMRLSATSLRADVPGSATTVPGQYPVQIENGSGGSAPLRSNILYFTVAAVAGAPVIVDYTPDNGVTGDKVLIVGRDLVGDGVMIRDSLGVTAAPGMAGMITWLGQSLQTIELVIPDGWHTGPITITHMKGSYQGKIFNVGRNLATAVGTTLFASSEYGGTWTIPRGGDNNLATSWFSKVGDCASQPTCTSIPWYRVDFAAPQVVARIALRGNREYMGGYDFLRGKFEVLGEGGAVLWSSSYDLPEPDRDLDLVLPTPIGGARSVKFTSERDESAEPGFSDLEVFGP